MSKVEKPFELTRRRGKHCLHRATEVCGEERIVTCKTCGATLDPIEVLVMMAGYRERLMFENKHARDQRDRVRAELEELKRDVRNTKARIRRNTPKAPETVAPELVPGAVILHIDRRPKR